mmetsp:Transcript_30425/g.93462  ORF Transcript_30425/g.93462 Transcript_30425/m.93462 type:complete len:625 (-) Transcript_30425:83-1957(-)
MYRRLAAHRLGQASWAWPAAAPRPWPSLPPASAAPAGAGERHPLLPWLEAEVKERLLSMERKLDHLTQQVDKFSHSPCLKDAQGHLGVEPVMRDPKRLRKKMSIESINTLSPNAYAIVASFDRELAMDAQLTDCQGSRRGSQFADCQVNRCASQLAADASRRGSHLAQDPSPLPTSESSRPGILKTPSVLTPVVPKASHDLGSRVQAMSTGESRQAGCESRSSSRGSHRMRLSWVFPGKPRRCSELTASEQQQPPSKAVSMREGLADMEVQEVMHRTGTEKDEGGASKVRIAHPEDSEDEEEEEGEQQGDEEEDDECDCPHCRGCAMGSTSYHTLPVPSGGPPGTLGPGVEVVRLPLRALEDLASAAPLIAPRLPGHVGTMICLHCLYAHTPWDGYEHLFAPPGLRGSMRVVLVLADGCSWHHYPDQHTLCAGGVSWCDLLDVASMERADALLEKLVDHEAELLGGRSERVVLMGTSQGGGQAMLRFLRSRRRLGGWVGSVCHVPTGPHTPRDCDPLLAEGRPVVNCDRPVRLLAGEADSVFPPGLVLRDAARLREVGGFTDVEVEVRKGLTHEGLEEGAELEGGAAADPAQRQAQREVPELLHAQRQLPAMLGLAPPSPPAER